MTTIWIDAGHGGTAPGAVNGARMEKNDTLRFALELERQFRARGVETAMTRRRDEFLTLNERTRLERERKCNLAISCHRNSGGAGAHGIEIWVHHAAQPEVVAWAGDTAKELARASGMALRSGTAAPGVYKGYRGNPKLDYAVNRETESPSMLLELGFLSNSEDNSMFDANIAAMCQAVVNASSRFLGISAPEIDDETGENMGEDGEKGNCCCRHCQHCADCKKSTNSSGKTENLYAETA